MDHEGAKKKKEGPPTPYCPSKNTRRWMRLDIFLNKCCLTRRRSEARRACDNGIVAVDDQTAKASRALQVGQRVAIGFADRYLEVEILALPEGNISKKAAPDYYRVIRDEVREPEF